MIEIWNTIQTYISDGSNLIGVTQNVGYLISGAISSTFIFGAVVYVKSKFRKKRRYS